MLKSKTLTRLLSLVLALFLWFYVIAIEDPPVEKKITNIPIEFINDSELENRGLAINYEDIQKMDAVIAGARSDVLKTDSTDMEATADVSGYNKGKNYVPVTVKAPRKVEVIEQKTQAVEVKIEKLLTKKMPVDVIFSGKTKKADIIPHAISVNMNNVYVSGAKSQVEKVEKVAGTIAIDNLKFYKDNYKVKLEVFDKNGLPISGLKLSTRKANVVAGLYETKIVELAVDLKGAPPAEYSIEEMKKPVALHVLGFAKDLEKIDKVTTSPVYLDDVTQNQDIQLKVELPEGIVVDDTYDELKLSVKVKKMGSKTFEFSGEDINIRGLDTEKKAEILPTHGKITIFAKDLVLSKINTETLDVFVDLMGMQIGQQSVKLRVEAIVDGEDLLSNGSSHVSISPQDVVVSIN